jgi:hypothetical protein
MVGLSGHFAGLMGAKRYLCSELVALRVNSADSIVNLEEIWREGAAFDSDDPIVGGESVELRCGAAFFAGKVTQVERHEFGWRVEVEFSPLTPWNPEQFRPQHLLGASSPNESEPDESESQAE